jgi:predicted nucleic-acid-binding Zn-ribbon protein
MLACPKCGKKDLWEEGKIISGGMYGIQNLFRPIKKKTLQRSLLMRSFACKNCGHIEFYINPKELKEILRD